MENKKNDAMNNTFNRKENKVPFSYRYEDDGKATGEHDSSDPIIHDTAVGEVQSVEKFSKVIGSLDAAPQPSRKMDFASASIPNTDSQGNDVSLDVSKNIPATFSSYNYQTPYSQVQMCYAAGLSLRDAQAINRMICMNEIDLYYKHRKNAEALTYMKAVDDYKRTVTVNNDITFDEAGNMVPIPKKKGVDFREMEARFIEKHSVVKVRSRYLPEWFFMMRSKYYNRHVVVSEKDLEQDYYDFLDDYLPDDIDITQSAKQDSLRRMKRTVVKLQDSHLYILKGHEVMFLDGIYNVCTNEFRPIPVDSMSGFFNMFSVEVEYGNGQEEKPDVFDAFLHMILDGNENALHCVYQMIGSILTPVGSLKKCHLLQGVAGSGKTSLVRYIERMMPIEDFVDLPNLSKITDDSLVKRDQPVRLVHVCELGTNKLPAKQVVNLKAFADGADDLPGVASFKIILTTNHKVVTGNDGVIETALKNRLLVIPFPKPLNLENADPRVASLDDIYFEQERRGIILKALRAYGEVLNNNGNFCCDFEVNAVVDEPEKPDEHLSAEEKERISNGLPVEAASMLPALAEAFDSTFVLTDEINPQITATTVMKAINAIRPKLLENEPTVGRKLRQHFGERLKTGRPNGITAYNLAFAGQNAETASTTAE